MYIRVEHAHREHNMIHLDHLLTRDAVRIIGVTGQMPDKVSYVKLYHQGWQT
jgi:hypothetical protein